MADLVPAAPTREGGNTPVAVLQYPGDAIPREEKNIKLDDYLNDKIQAQADFASLPSLLLKVEGQRRDLEKQARNCVLVLGTFLMTV
jgi:hypothetical protein